jgi:hypothetical protein
LKPLKAKDVVSVYEGEAQKCCCGCAGESYYNPAYTEQIAGYVGEHVMRQPKPEEFNQEKVAAITKLVKTHIECGTTSLVREGYYFLELNGMQYHAYTIAESEAFRRFKNEWAAKHV